MDEPMQKRTRVSREEWVKRVERWRDSGLTTADFAAELGINPHNLTYGLDVETRGRRQEASWPKKSRKQAVRSEGGGVEHAVRGGEEPHAARAVRARDPPAGGCTYRTALTLSSYGPCSRFWETA
jgi:hypothetical protein